MSATTGTLAQAFPPAVSVSAASSVTSGIVGSSTISPLYTTINNGGITSIKSMTVVSQDGRLVLKGVHADIDVNGKSLVGWMEKVEQRLDMLTPNPGMETEWEQLKQLGDQYRNLEKICEEKSMIWQKLKAVQPTPS